MHDWAEKLLALQDLDQRILRLQQQAATVPQEKQKNQSLLDEGKTATAAAKAAVQECEKQLKALSLEVATIEGRMRDFQSKSAMIKNNTEYKAALQQIADCREVVRKLEDKELELMESLEAAKADLAAKTKDQAATEARVREMQADLDKRAAAAAAEVERQSGRRAELLQAVPPNIAQRYERLRQSPRYKDGIIFVPVRESTCGRCHMNITYQARMDARKGMLVSCGNCGVLLFSEE